MRKLVFVLMLTGSVLWAKDYSTQFELTQNPLSESSNWLSAEGTSWSNVRSTPGLAFGTQQGNENCPPNCNDSTAILSGTWGANQMAQATVYKGTLTATYDEVELRLRSTLTTSSSRGYEILFSVNPKTSYGLQLVKWLGPLGSYTLLAENTSIHPANGDVVSATATGSSPTVIKISVNGKQVLQYSDSSNPWTDGAPGIGFGMGTGNGTANQAANANFGFKQFYATDTPPPPGGLTAVPH